jgi:hypothetical protein
LDKNEQRPNRAAGGVDYNRPRDRIHCWMGTRIRYFRLRAPFSYIGFAMMVGA